MPIHGAGTSGTGIADLVCDAMIRKATSGPSTYLPAVTPLCTLTESGGCHARLVGWGALRAGGLGIGTVVALVFGQACRAQGRCEVLPMASTEIGWC